MIEKRHAGTQEQLIQEVFNIWSEDIKEAKFNIAAAADIAAMEARLGGMNDQANKNAKKVLARCGAASEQQIRDMCFVAWVDCYKEYLKNKEEEDAVRAEEKRIQEFMKSHSENAKGLLNNMAGATNTGLLHEVFLAWCEYYKEEKQVNAYAEFMAKQQGQMGAFGSRNKKGAQSVMERAHEHNMIMLYLKIFGAWRLDCSVEKLLKVHQGRIDGKRQQLVGVQQMFRNFAKQLESNIQSGGDSNRELAAGPPSRQKGRTSLQKTEGTVSLPDIHSKPGSNAGC